MGGPVPAFYGVHDTFIRDGIAFVCAWNTGVIIYDVGNGMKGGTPAAPIEIPLASQTRNFVGTVLPSLKTLIVPLALIGCRIA